MTVAEAGAETIHASAVALHDRGVLIRGAPGSGKSALALALTEDWRGDAVLISDDRVILAASGNGLVAVAPEALQGLIEVRGIGIVKRPFRADAVVCLVVDLLPLEACPRLPEPAERTTELLGRTLPRLMLAIGAPDGALRVRIAMTAWAGQPLSGAVNTPP